jgi:hypothetical protein
MAAAEPASWLEDILEGITVLRDVVERNIERISEASRHIRPEGEASWDSMAEGRRHRQHPAPRLPDRRRQHRLGSGRS